MADKIKFAEPIDVEQVRRIFEGSHDPVARLNGLALLAALEEARRERDEARWHQERCHRHHEASDADLERMRPVVEAAKAWRMAWAVGVDGYGDADQDLLAAVDSYEKTQESTE